VGSFCPQNSLQGSLGHLFESSVYPFTKPITQNNRLQLHVEPIELTLKQLNNYQKVK